MTLLVGQNDSTAFTGGVELANDSQTDFGVFTAVASGTATTINMWMTVQSGAETFRLGLWNGTTGAPITQSAELSPTGSGDQWISAAISASIVSGTSYILGIFGGANSATNPIFFYTDGTGTGTFEDATSGYPTQPTAGLNVTGQIGNMAIYIDGTTGGSGAVLASTPAAHTGAAGALSTKISAVGQVGARTSAVAALTTAGRFAAVAQSRASAVSALTSGISLAGGASARTGLLAALTNFATVVLSGTLYTGIGGALDPNFWPDGVLPTVGTTLYYDPTFITIETSGEIVSTSNNCISAVGFYVGSTWYPGIIALTPQMVGYANAATSALAALTTGFALSAAVSARTSASAVMSAVGATLSASALARTGFAAGISTGINLAATGSAKAQAQSPLTTGISMVAQIYALTYASATLGAGAMLTVTAAGLASASGALFTGIALSGSASARSTVSGTLAASPVVLSADAFARPSAGSALLTGIAVAGSANARSGATSSLAGPSASLSAVISARTSASGSLSASIAFSASLTARPYALASITVGAGLAADASCRPSAASNANQQISLVGPRYVIKRIRARRWTVSATTYLQFDPKGSDEKVRLCFDFAPDLLPGVTLVGTPVVTYSVGTGNDQAPSALANGTPILDGTKTIAIVPVQGGIGGCAYSIHAWCATTDPLVALSLTGILSVQS